MVKKLFTIEGMHCGACAAGIELILSNTEGIKSVKADYEGKKAEVEYDEAKLSADDVINAIADAGFGAKAVS
ncbi:MAG: heavy-metal-associated domain-containing protein [Parcubacteria group bacterium]|nr:heavy-metal-associated domain-containing protein [Parcubacteria group bacterium]